MATNDMKLLKILLHFLDGVSDVCSPANIKTAFYTVYISSTNVHYPPDLTLQRRCTNCISFNIASLLTRVKFRSAFPKATTYPVIWLTIYWGWLLIYSWEREGRASSFISDNLRTWQKLIQPMSQIISYTFLNHYLWAYTIFSIRLTTNCSAFLTEGNLWGAESHFRNLDWDMELRSMLHAKQSSTTSACLTAQAVTLQQAPRLLTYNKWWWWWWWWWKHTGCHKP